MINENAGLGDIITKELLDDVVGEKREMLPISQFISLEALVSREVSVDDAISTELAEYFYQMVNRWNRIDAAKNIPVDERTPIVVTVNSPGGDTYATMSIVETIKASKTPVITINTGVAFSGGSLILMAGHKRYTYKNAVALIHKGSVGFEGDAIDTEEFMDFYRKYSTNYVGKHILDSTNISEELYEEKERSEWFMDSEEMVELGVVDEYYTTREEVLGNGK